MHLTSLLPFFLVISLTRADVLRLNRKNFESAAAGKNVFIKFFAPGYVGVSNGLLGMLFVPASESVAFVDALNG
jgi:hypothetical protein